MDVFLTGGTGLVGSEVLRALLADGHAVHALARSESAAQNLVEAGAVVVHGDITDLDVIATAAREADAVIHAASPGDATSRDVDLGVARTVAPLGTTYLHTGGCWVFGSGADLDEHSPLDPPPLTAWRPEVEAVVLDGGGTIVAPGVVYGHGAGLPNLVVDAPQRDGRRLMFGDGTQHWTTVHAADLGRLYARVLAAAPRGDYVFAVSGQNPTVAELFDAVGGGLPSTPEELEQRVGPLAAPLLLDQQGSGAHARSYGWEPTMPSLVEELRSGSYVR